MSLTPPPPLRLGARRSPLARAQVELVASMLAAHGIETTFVGITTTGDVDRRALTEIGGTGVFATAVRSALRTGEIDLAVHSLKDLPTAGEDDLEVIAVPAREDTRDVLVGARLEDLGDGARVGTGAPRRAAQLEHWAASQGVELDVVPIRGNVDTRIEQARAGSVQAVVLAAAGLRRLGRLTMAGPDNSDTVVSGLPAHVLDHSVMLPAPGQGALALEVSRDLAPAHRERLATLDDAVARAECLVERGFLATLEAGCTAPVGARAIVKSVRGTRLDLTLAAVIGKTLLSNLSEPTNSGSEPRSSGILRIEVSGESEDPEQFGCLHAGEVLSQLLDPRLVVE